MRSNRAVKQENREVVLKWHQDRHVPFTLELEDVEALPGLLAHLPKLEFDVLDGWNRTAALPISEVSTAWRTFFLLRHAYAVSVDGRFIERFRRKELR